MDALTLHGVDYRWGDNHTLEVDVEKAEGLNPVFTQLSEQGVQVMSMRNKSNRLEELFVRLVESAKQAE
jgi:ABC-2 type transport system ATP-binding protein